MGLFNEVEGMFRGVSYNRYTSPQVREAMTRKLEAVQAKIAERVRRIEKIVADNEITPEALSDLIIQYTQDQGRHRNSPLNKMSYSVSIAPKGNEPARETVVPAGVIANLATEKELITSEQTEVKRLNLILRNLRDRLPCLNEKTGDVEQREVVHTLDDADLEYLGF